MGIVVFVFVVAAAAAIVIVIRTENISRREIEYDGIIVSQTSYPMDGVDVRIQMLPATYFNKSIYAIE